MEDISIEYEAESATTLQQAEINESSFVEESNLESHDECQSESKSFARSLPAVLYC